MIDIDKDVCNIVDIRYEDKEMYYSDKPITCINEDLLCRKNFAELIAKSVVGLNNEDTFTVGLYGKWGTGKTSLVNMMLEKIAEYQQQNKEIIVVHFEPWNFSNQLLEQFFLRLINRFRDSKDKKLAAVGEALERYSEAFEMAKVIPYVGELLSVFGKKGAESLSAHLKKGADEKDVMRQKDHVIQLLKAQDKRILIVIDDIDRLNNEQIRQVFQLITSVAKFPNTIYLLVFDKEIVTRALEKVQEGSGEEYLEKIIQMPIQIPDVQKTEIRQILFDRLHKIIEAHGDVAFEQEHWRRLYGTCAEPLINNLRDVNRICNSMQLKLSALSSDVDFTDLLIISIIEISYPGVFEWIKRNKSVLTGEYDPSSLYSRDKPQKEQYEFYLSEIKKVVTITGNCAKSVEDIIDILSRLFPYFGKKIGKTFEVYDWNLFRKNNNIAHPEKFDRYFDLNVDYIKLRKTSVMNAIHSMSCEELTKYIVTLDEEESSYEFLEEIYAAVSDISEKRAYVIINAIFNCTYRLDMASNKYLFSTSSKQYAEMLVLPLFDRITADDRYIFLKSIIQQANLSTLPTVAQIINMLELAYGRLSANGEERDLQKIVSLDELLKLEQDLIIKIKYILEDNSLFDFSDYRMILHLMENYEPEYTKRYMDLELQNDNSVLMYLSNTISTWIGSGVSYEISNSYEKYLNKGQILEVIQRVCTNKELFQLPIDVQRLSAAFYLNETGDLTYRGHVSQSDADDLIEIWKSK